MKVTVELSLYPLREKYTAVIIGFIKSLKEYQAIQVHTTAMSTYVTGEYDAVMQSLQVELKKIYEVVPDSATVIKIIPKDLNVEDGFLRF
ncbi:MAG: YkoF family thiamine/hydroxymethylpyrimidine-binding protein [Bacteroidota bacterium]